MQFSLGQTVRANLLPSAGVLAQINWGAVAATVAFATVTLVALALGNDLLERFYWDGNSIKLYLPYAGAVALAAIFARTRYREFSPMMRACMRASAVGLTVLIVLEWPNFTLANPDTAARAAHYVAAGAFLTLGLSIASWFRPAFILPVAIYLLSTRHLIEIISGVLKSMLDIQYMLDMALYLVVLGFAVTKLGPKIHPWLGNPARQNEVLGVVFGLHLANYFWSGIAKVFVGPTPWFWAMENKTYNQIPYTIESGIFPLGHIPWLTDLAYQGFQIAHIPMNAMIVLAQVFAIVCVLRIGWLKVASFMYEMLHIGIYLLGGLFFWPWIWNNLTVWWAAKRSKEGLPTNLKIACIVTILLGAPWLDLNKAALLGWYDITDARQIYIEAVTEDGREVKVPNGFFNSHSSSFSHAWLGQAALEGHYDYTPLASNLSLERKLKDGQCVDPSTLEGLPLETPEAKAIRHEKLERFLTAHHAKMLGLEESPNFPGHNIHIHHHPSNPFLYKEFNSLPLSEVVGYQQVIESACHRMVNGRVEKTIIARDTEYVSVR